MRRIGSFFGWEEQRSEQRTATQAVARNNSEDDDEERDADAAGAPAADATAADPAAVSATRPCMISRLYAISLQYWSDTVVGPPQAHAIDIGPTFSAP